MINSSARRGDGWLLVATAAEGGSGLRCFPKKQSRRHLNVSVSKSDPWNHKVHLQSVEISLSISVRKGPRGKMGCLMRGKGSGGREKLLAGSQLGARPEPPPPTPTRGVGSAVKEIPTATRQWSVLTALCLHRRHLASSLGTPRDRSKQKILNPIVGCKKKHTTTEGDRSRVQWIGFPSTFHR